MKRSILVVVVIILIIVAVAVARPNGRDDDERVVFPPMPTIADLPAGLPDWDSGKR